MKKNLLFSMVAVVALSACAFNSKQPKDDTYYKKTQGISWSEGQKAVTQKTTTTAAQVKTASYGASGAADPQLNWQDPAAPARQVAIPKAPEKKLQCVKTDRNAYTCRLGQYQCGTGCQADGSNCRYGYCLQSDCDDVLGQKWDLVYQKNYNLHACQHPTAKVSCRPDASDGISCWGSDAAYCGHQCNKNGTQCSSGSDTCWAKYRNVN